MFASVQWILPIELRGGIHGRGGIHDRGRIHETSILASR